MAIHRTDIYTQRWTRPFLAPKNTPTRSERGPDLLSGLIVLPQSQAKDALKKYAEFTKAMPEELNIWVVLRKAPPLPFLPEDVHGTDVIIFALCYAGDPAEGEEAVAPVREWGDPVGDMLASSRSRPDSRPSTRC